MVGRKFKIMLATLAIMSIPICAMAGPRAIISDSVTIDKGDSSVVIPPREVLEGLTNESGSSGSLKIRLSDTKKNNSKEGVIFSLSKIADIEDGTYKVKDNYSSVEVDLNNIKTANDLELAAGLFKEVVVTDNTMETNSNGECSIEELEVGVYLVYAKNIAGYDNITPFIVSVPHWNEADGMVYDLEVIPKHTEIIKKENPNKVPPTAYNDKAIFNLAIGSILLLGSGALFIGVRKKERK